MRAAWLAALLLAGCSGGKAPEGNAQVPQDLESAAIERGLIRDPADTEIAGLYARDTDRLCIVSEDAGYRIGAFVDYGERITCSGSGTVTRIGDQLHVSLGGDGDGCSFDARFTGERIEFPGNMPDGCRMLCSGRASFAGLTAARLSNVASEARALRDPRGRALCGG